jgi:hypothetical protein
MFVCRCRDVLESLYLANSTHGALAEATDELRCWFRPGILLTDRALILGLAAKLARLLFRAQGLPVEMKAGGEQPLNCLVKGAARHDVVAHGYRGSGRARRWCGL